MLARLAGIAVGLVLALHGAASAGENASPAAPAATVSIERLELVAQGTRQTIERLEAQLAEQRGVLLAVEFLVREARGTLTPAPAATPAP